MEHIELPGYHQIENEDQLKAIFLNLLEDRSELGSSFRDEVQDIVRRHCGEEVDLSSSVRIAEKDKIDITIECANVVECENIVLLIELKWKGKERRGQTELYEKVVNCFYHDWKKVFLFITKNGDTPMSSTWVPVKLEPSAKTWDSNAIAPDILERHNSEELSEQTGILEIPKLLGPDFPRQLCERAESLTGIPHAVCRQYDKQGKPSKVYSGGWYGADPGPGRYLRLFERTMAETPEFYVASADGWRLPFVMSEVLIDGLELRIKYHNCAQWEMNKGFPSAQLAKTRLIDAIKQVKPEKFIWVLRSNAVHNIFHQKRIISRLEFDELRSKPNQLKATVLDRAGDFYREFAAVYTQAGRDFMSRLAEYR